LSRVLSFAIIFILVLFLFFFAFFWLLPHLRTPPSAPSPELKKEEISLTLTSPEDNQVTDIASVKIAGKTNPQALIVIYSQDNEEVLEASQDGSFSINFPLSEGLNEITIINQTKDGEEKSVTRDVYYSREELQK
jgi:cellulose synthase/poly-beta-1,6-N-acetylglucosamine synthase-like glycosyltransferase